MNVYKNLNHEQESIARRLVQASESDLAGFTAGQRILRSLLLNIPTTRRQLSELLGADREMARAIIWGDAEGLDARNSIPHVTVVSESRAGDNRRRIPRLPFVSGVVVDIEGPESPLQGVEAKTENITEYGVKLVFERFRRSGYERWQKSLDDEEPIEIGLVLPEYEELPRLDGQIVWTTFDPEPDDEKRGTCAVGVMLHILSPDLQRALRGFIQRYVTR